MISHLKFPHETSLGHRARSANRNFFLNTIEGFIKGKKANGRSQRIWIDGIKVWTNAKKCRKQKIESTERRTVKIHDRQPSIFRGRYVVR